jgi:hypothetical protein
MDLQATLAGSFTFTIWRPPVKSSRCPLVACSDVMGSSVKDILGAAVALAPAVIGAAIGSQIRETGPNRRRAKQLFAIHPPSPGGGECRMHRTRFEKRKRKNPEETPLR